MVTKIKDQVKETIQWSREIQKRLKGSKSQEQQDLNVHHILEELFKQVDRNKDEYVCKIDTCKEKYISDSETIKMALTKLLTSHEHEDSIPREKALRLQELLRCASHSENGGRDEMTKLKERENSLAALEKEVIGILSRRFKK